MALVSTQLLTERTTRNLLGSKGRLIRLTTLPPSVSRLPTKFGSHEVSLPYEPARPSRFISRITWLNTTDVSGPISVLINRVCVKIEFGSSLVIFCQFRQHRYSWSLIPRTLDYIFLPLDSGKRTTTPHHIQTYLCAERQRTHRTVQTNRIKPRRAAAVVRICLLEQKHGWS
jgi:hypothetical protein